MMSIAPEPTVEPGALMMVDIPGVRLDAATTAFLREAKIRAVCLFRRNFGSEAEVALLTRELREVLGPRALIALDQEGGSVVRSTFLPQAPSAMALGAADDERLARDVGAGVARSLRSLGINWNFAPVLDVNNNPANPVIAERSFGETPNVVTRLAGAWMDGSLHEGVACCVKHFPGHGDTTIDSHVALPTVARSRAELDALELAPFHALRHAAPAMMTAHILYPTLDHEHPATLSRAIVGGILRDEWGYDGVVITDALMMKAISERYGYARAAVMAIAAGADMVLAQGSIEDQRITLDALRNAFADGVLPEARGVEARIRLDHLATRFPATCVEYTAQQRAADTALMQRAWAAGLTVVRGARPPARNAPLRVIVQAEVPTDHVDEAGVDGVAVLAQFEGFTDVQPLLLDDLSTLDWNALPRDGRSNILVSTRRERYGAAARMLRPDLHLVLWNPFQALDVRAPALLTWGYADGALAALRAWLNGQASAPGLPLPSLLEANTP